MERRFAARRDQLLADAEVDPRIPRGVPPRLERFLDPFVEWLQRSEPGGHAPTSIAGLVSDLEYKNVESIAYLHDQPREPLQQFIGQSPWDHGPWLGERTRQVGRELGDANGVLVLDPSAFPKRGDASVGVQRPWCGRLGKIDNCQGGVYLASVGPSEHALVDVRLSLPKEWAKDRRRRQQAGVPREVRFRTRREWALEMLDERGPLLPHAWVAGDDEMGRCSWFREHLRSRGECYLLAVPSNASLTTPLAEYARVFKAEHRVEECLQRAKGEAGLADYEVRTWRGWHHHQALALVATWFLTMETRRGKKRDAGVDGSAVAEADRGGVGPTVGYEPFGVPASHREPAFTAD